MLLLGHTGITLGAAAILTAALRRTPSSGESFSRRAAWFISLGEYLDIRLLMVGSLLPDIIDKPLGLFFLRETIGHGRIFAHTFLFLIVLMLFGYYLYRYRSRNWMLILAFGTLAHLVFDDMWRFPQTLFWPFFGSAFGKEPAGWVVAILRGLLTDPETYITELVGGAILFWFVLVLVRRRRVAAFIRHGRV